MPAIARYQLAATRAFHAWLCALCRNLHFFVGGNFGDVFASEIGYDRNTEDLHACVVCNNNFRNSRHADCIAADYAEKFIFRRSLECRSRSSYIDSAHESEAVGCRIFECRFAQSVAIGLCHSRKAWAELVVVAAS